jgi:DNA polymerase I
LYSATLISEQRKHTRTLLDYVKSKPADYFAVEYEGMRFKVRYRNAPRHEYSLVPPIYELVTSLKSGFLLGSYYDGHVGKAYLKFYNDADGKVYVWYDQSGHLPYFITNLRPDEVKDVKKIVEDPSFVRVESVKKHDLLRGKDVRLTKIIVKDPQAVPRMRKLVPEAWEAKIKYHDNYVYDNGLVPGLEYDVVNGTPKEIKHDIAEDVLNLYRNAASEDPRSLNFAMRLAPLFETRPPDVRRLAIDIEVYTPFRGRVPDPERTPYPIISVALYGSDGLKKVLVLKRESLPFGSLSSLPEGVEVEVFDSERDLIIEVFRIINEYPLLLTFNGDDFDLPYLYNRAVTLGIDPDYIPVRPVRDFIGLRHGFHIDLYRFFSIEAIQNYAFGSAYKEKTLDAIAHALLGEAKVSLEEGISELYLSKLIEYNAKDAELTLKLTTFDNELVWKLMILIMRLAKMSLEDVTRRKVSAWVKSLMFWEHRRRGYLIPNPEELLSLKGEVKTAARIGGKRYSGAIVIDPIPGVYFRVTVLDFASLYPSIIKVWNLSYETIDPPEGWCPGDGLREIKDEQGNTLHRVCTARKGITTEIVGMLRDFSVRVYKKLAKSSSTPEDLRNWYDVVQRAMKVYINASYGVFGHEKFPFYTPSLAESVTALGRYVISSTLKKASELGLRVLYGDTDSLFLWDPPEVALNELIEWVDKNFNLDLELDKKYRFVAFALKKNYLGVLENGKIDVKGLVGKKKNVPKFLQDVFTRVVELMIKIEDNPVSLEMVKEDLKKEVKELYRRLRDRDFTLDEVAFKTTLNKDVDSYVKTTPIHVKAALQLRRYGLHIARGDIILYVKTRTKDKVKAIQLAKLSDVDVNEYMEAAKSVLQQLLTPFNISWEEVAGGVGLFSFLNNPS